MLSYVLTYLLTQYTHTVFSQTIIESINQKAVVRRCLKSLAGSVYRTKQDFYT